MEWNAFEHTIQAGLCSYTTSRADVERMKREGRMNLIMQVIEDIDRMGLINQKVTRSRGGFRISTSVDMLAFRREEFSRVVASIVKATFAENRG